MLKIWRLISLRFHESHLQIDELFEYVEEDVEEDPSNEAESTTQEKISFGFHALTTCRTLGRSVLWTLEICEALMQFEGGGLAKAKKRNLQTVGS